MECRTIKDDGQVQEETKNYAFDLPCKAYYSEEEAELSSLLLRKNTIKRPTTALLLLSVKAE